MDYALTPKVANLFYILFVVVVCTAERKTDSANEDDLDDHVTSTTCHMTGPTLESSEEELVRIIFFVKFDSCLPKCKRL